jgi:hypothetical protein
MCSAFRAAVREHLPSATLVVDHFHLVQLANQMVSSVRRGVTATLRGCRVRKDEPRGSPKKNSAPCWPRVRTSTARRQISHHLWTFCQCDAYSDIPELHRLAAAIQARDHPGMVAADRGIDPHRHPNAARRGVNRLIELERHATPAVSETHQPTPTIALRKHPRILATNQARLTSKTRLFSYRRANSAIRSAARIKGEAMLRQRRGPRKNDAGFTFIEF